MQPNEYLSATASYDADQRLTIITVKAQPNFSGAVCPVSVSFSSRPASRADREERQGWGVSTNPLTRAAKKVRLVAKNIEFEKNPAVTKVGKIAVHADGFDRAFLFKADYDIPTGSRAFNEAREPAIRIRGAQQDGEGKIRLLSQPVSEFRVPVERG